MTDSDRIARSLFLALLLALGGLFLRTYFAPLSPRTLAAQSGIPGSITASARM